MIHVTLDRTSAIPLIRQLYDGMRAQILSGVLRPGSRLPSSREMAGQLGVSRNVVVEAFEMLYSEGFTTARHGSGTFVAPGTTFPAAVAEKKRITLAKVSMGYESQAGVINFKPGTPDLREFPLRAWLQAVKAAYLHPADDSLGYGQPEGRRELRQAICDYVVSQRGVACDPDQIVITAGTTQAIGIACHLLLGERRDVILEDPITRDIQLIVKGEGGVIHPVTADDSGLVVEELPSGISPAFVYVTPSHQFPLGGTLAIQRRIALLEYVERTGACLIEDDYDSEFRFDGPALASLQSLAPDRVVYIGTFSKTLSPALRTGYLILPPALVGEGRGRKWHCDLHNETPTQLALAHFIATGGYLRHLGRMKRLYARKRRVLEQALAAHFGAAVRIIGSATGLHLAARFSGIVFTPELLAELEKKRVRVYPAEAHAIKPGRLDDIILIGYGNLSEAQIEQGIRILHRVINR
ncbi:putative HTH-type transcriptional regulator YhdI [Geobacter sp. OR-1]|uniref:MocR-like pyridoxine biosynthesis transcription factor PdxR n=1 Tax=Geobacter sp. OR-1 TaxID=1266765 RepID=UPI000543C136|nr:PLP-dependent aminotransferase family protein [Geobacter sp. OR-1]GAM10896.1 putative HTH-type transcriptional regulator YhdI [Geobacter sp. OR-1]